MKTAIVTLGLFVLAPLLASGCGKGQPAAAPAVARKLFLDVHELGAGKVNPTDLAGAHAKDKAIEAQYGVEYQAYWLDQARGKVYCLVEAPSADAARAVHQHAHGLVADKIMEVVADNKSWVPTPGSKLFVDIHELGPGKVTAQDVAGAHLKDLAVQAKHGVRFLNYWVDPASGTVACLSESPSAEATVAVHREAHGLLPARIDEVVEGR